MPFFDRSTISGHSHFSIERQFRSIVIFSMQLEFRGEFIFDTTTISGYCHIFDASRISDNYLLSVVLIVKSNSFFLVFWIKSKWNTSSVFFKCFMTHQWLDHVVESGKMFPWQEIEDWLSLSKNNFWVFGNFYLNQKYHFLGLKAIRVAIRYKITAPTLFAHIATPLIGEFQKWLFIYFSRAFLFTRKSKSLGFKAWDFRYDFLA